ncbi:UbiX family flavin prenyltransferase [Trinickia caryophylli]|uniref:Flavin prenyltransferase UbiX n=1 Tax=Trinickia caryophylli TaxID=28094 RepID=A0A1X7CPN8_TRICW|nr:UbiX family flavin prenyltransferase [Trinickia caryophylli]PMS11279.1 UbiX family flavin prenyltransferase [Trinickia caryophylli]TRX20132.1 UbiX family flavin prenyltransferase [Trinickia caryophylli]WQE12517.1 UbiX family flavin prenyltransferase [Trinickia caryophylli]SMF00115.1 4-hydroxy-3-polyprenylbenzoate decarboxylase [Trinickia caryophylli]GLU30201.1 aromatic acid decarboxylase [Trinickia caryophylli]
MNRQRIIVGISGATGFQYGVKALQLLRLMDIEVHLVLSRGAELTRSLETEYDRNQVHALADQVHAASDLGASISSGSFKTIGMLVAPCSMRSLAAIAHACSDNLLTRAADVVLKERRRLVLMARETPLTLAHIDNMRRVTEMGGIVFPPVPALYQRPATLDDVLTHSVGRALDLFELEVPSLPRWRELAA